MDISVLAPGREGGWSSSGVKFCLSLEWSLPGEAP